MTGSIVKFWMVGDSPPNKEAFGSFRMALDADTADALFEEEVSTKRNVVLIECVGEVKREQNI